MIGVGVRDNGFAAKLDGVVREILDYFGRIRFSAARSALTCLAVGLTIEALLGLRVWAQISNHSLHGGPLGLVFGLTDLLVQPFRSFEPSQPIRETGIIEIATLVAMEAYLIGTLALFFMLLGGSLAARVIKAPPQLTSGNAPILLPPAAILMPPARPDDQRHRGAASAADDTGLPVMPRSATSR